MSGKYSDNRFFFANYGCCIPTESYAWILVALFITAILVLLFCMLATATIRWMYKRRMRKRLHDLKRKFLMDQVKAQEFEAKLNYMAQKNKSNKNDDLSKEGGDKFTIYVDPAQNQAQHLNNSAKNKKKTSNNLAQKATAPGPIYDQDETPIAQSTLASQSNTNAKMRNENRWLFLPKNQKPSKPMTDDTTPIPTPNVQPAPVHAIAGVPLPPPQGPPANIAPAPMYNDVPPPIIVPQKTSPPKKSPPKGDVDFGGTSPIIPLDPTDVSPENTKNNELAPPTTTTATPSGTTPTTDVTTTPTTETTIPSTGNTPGSGTSDSSFTTPILPVPPAPSPPKNKIPSPPQKSKTASPPKDDVKQNVQYEMDIVSPVAPDKGSDKGSDKNEDAKDNNRKEGAGGRGEWKYYYADANGSEGKKGSAVSTATKSSTSHRRSSRSWLFDSTGSNRFEAGGGSGSAKTNSTVSSSILKTDSSHYKTASIEQFPHGAFTFQ